MVTPRVKQRCQVASCRIDTREVRTFPKIAMLASQCEVAIIVGSTVLLGDHMLYVVCQVAVFLRQ
jgi:hypothetical protein